LEREVRKTMTEETKPQIGLLSQKDERILYVISTPSIGYNCLLLKIV
jgi:hypothetical protein